MTLKAKILRVLRSSPLPCSTPDLVLLTAFGKKNARAQVWQALRELEAARAVKKAGARRHTGTRGGWTETLWSAS